MRKDIACPLSSSYERVVFISDVHSPYEDQKALSILYNFIKWFKPKTVFIMGDLLDCYAISRFTKDPKGKLNFKKEIDSAKSILKTIKEVSRDAKIYYLRGNHELRMQKYLWNRAEELSMLPELEISHLLGLPELEIEYIERGMMMYHGVMIKHGTIVRQYAGYSAKAEFEKNGCSGVSGHTHRGAIYMHSNSGGDYKWMECGCLCSLEQEYMEGQTPNWQQGFGVGYFKTGSKRYQLDLINIIDNKALYNGVEFK